MKESAPCRPSLYTRQGDQGMTTLADGSCVAKDHVRVRACGLLDELNSLLGLLLSGGVGEETPLVQDIQRQLFNVGRHISAMTAARPLDAGYVARLEEAIDRLTAQVRPPQGFVIPGGSRQAALCHVARTVCRHAECEVVAVARGGGLDGGVLPYLNRLSDYLYDLALKLNI